MRRQGLWEAVSPSIEAFSSDQPFCFDTMTFSQWLQWVFVARFRAILEGGHPLPERCGVASMAEEAYRGQDLNDLVQLLDKFDQLFLLK